MPKFLLGFVAGVATYHYVSTSLDHQEIKRELRDFIKSVDEKLADEKSEGSPQSEEEGRVDEPRWQADDLDEPPATPQP